MRQSTNYKWNLPESADEIEIEDLNMIFLSIDKQLKSIESFVSSMIEGKDIVWLKYSVVGTSRGLNATVTVIFNGEERYSGAIQGTYPVQPIDSTYLRVWYNYNDDELSVNLVNSVSGRLPSGGPVMLFSSAIEEGGMGAHVQGMNNCSVGICAEGAYSREYMPDIQKRAIAELIDYLKTNYYPNSTVVGHREVGSSDCPGKNYPLEELKRYSEILNNGSEVLTMTQYEELKAEISALKTSADKLNSKMIYNYVDSNMPEWARPTIQKMMNKGLLKGDENGCLGLTDELLRVFVINDRAGLYD